MNSKSLFVSLAIVAVICAAVGFVLYATPHTGSVPSPVNSLIPNYALATGSRTVSSTVYGGVLTTTSTQEFSVNLTRGLTYGLHLGNTCQVQLSSATSTAGWSADAQITAIATGTATATVTFFNATNTAVTIATGTLTVICQNY